MMISFYNFVVARYGVNLHVVATRLRFGQETGFFVNGEGTRNIWEDKYHGTKI